MNLQIISALDGSTTSTDLSGLSRDLKPGILCRVEGDGSLTHVGLITTWDLVHFARVWAGWVNPEPIPQVDRCFNLVDRWLENPGSVSPEELEAAGRAAEGAARDAAGAAARAAGWAAWAAWAAEASARAADVAWAAGRAAARSAWAAGWAANEDVVHQRQGELVLETLASR